MNTYERHRQFLLRKNRTRIIRKRVFTIAGLAVLVIAAWSVVARLTPDAYAPPRPSEVGSAAAKQLARTAARSINSVHGSLEPDFREQAKRSVYALFDTTALRRDPAADSALAQEREQPGEPIQAGTSFESPRANPVPDSSIQSLPATHTTAPGKPDIAQKIDSPMQSRLSPVALLASGGLNGGMDGAKDPDSEGLDDVPAAAYAADGRFHRILDVLLIGLDSRLGNARGRADALHLLTIDLDAPTVRVTSIPRGTYTDLGYKNEASNIIANARAARGRKDLLRRVARLCRRDSVPYYVEVGFSDAFGLLELLGYRDPVAELQALRQRRPYQYGDHNRCYNQGLFIRRGILRLLPLLEGVTGDVLLRAGLDLVTTNLTRRQCRGIAYILNDAGQDRLPGLISVTLRSRFRKHIERDPKGGVYAHAVPGVDYEKLGGGSSAAERRIRTALATAEQASASPRRVRDELLVMFRQHGWLQVADRGVRRVLRDSLAVALISALTRLGREEEVREIHRTVQADDVLLRHVELSQRTDAGASEAGAPTAP